MVVLGKHNFKKARVNRNTLVFALTRIKVNLANLRKNFDINREYTDLRQ